MTADFELTDDEVDRRDFMEEVRELMGRPGMTLDQIRQAIAAGAPQAPYFTLADADRMVLDVQRKLVDDDPMGADEVLASLNHRIMMMLARSGPSAQLPWFRALAKKALQADSRIEEYEEEQLDRRQRAREKARSTTGAANRSGAEHADSLQGLGEQGHSAPAAGRSE